MGPLWGRLLVPGEVSVAGEELVVWSVCPKVERTYSLNLLDGWTHRAVRLQNCSCLDVLRASFHVSMNISQTRFLPN